MQDTPAMRMQSAEAASEVRRNTPLRQARTCYDHLAGVAGVRLLDEMLRRDWLKPCEASKEYRLTPAGTRELIERGVDVYQARAARRAFARGCVDWTERHHHLKGALASEILNALITDGFVHRPGRGRAVIIQKPIEKWLEPAV